MFAVCDIYDKNITTNKIYRDSAYIGKFSKEVFGYEEWIAYRLTGTCLFW